MRNHPESWVASPTPSAVQVSIGGGVNGSDRVEIVWNSADIINRWLQIAIKANDQTGLPETLSPINGSPIGDEFYFGNRVGDGNGDFRTNAGDGALLSNTSTADGAAHEHLRLRPERIGRLRRRRTGAEQPWFGCPRSTWVA